MRIFRKDRGTFYVMKFDHSEAECSDIQYQCLCNNTYLPTKYGKCLERKINKKLGNFTDIFEYRSKFSRSSASEDL